MAPKLNPEEHFAGLWAGLFPALPSPRRQFKDIPPWLDHLAVRKAAKPRSRAWVADFCWPELGIVVEVQGGTWKVGGHSSGAGIERDCMKAATLAAAGWLFFPLTTTMVKRKDHLFVRMVGRAVAGRLRSREA